jgi:heme/copper-type cytochrome/quinol oxidase subunit 1
MNRMFLLIYIYAIYNRFYLFFFFWRMYWSDSGELYYWYYFTRYLFCSRTFHYVLSLGAIYTICSCFYTYFNYFNSHFYINEFLGCIHFMLLFISSNTIFCSMHSLGILGLPRRIFDYPITYFRFHWFQSFGIIGIALSLALFVSLVLSFLSLVGNRASRGLFRCTGLFNLFYLIYD